ncbi:MAG TPA: OsmC family peroxiredoxin [Aeromonadales bacterium]|nr:OsmC family peroxiredoxin [Aeromonadales bacterium]
MSEHYIELNWQRSSEDFTYETYNRNHLIQFPGGQFIKASSAPAYFGDSELVNPEESLLAAVSSCHMLTVLAIAAKKKLVINHYQDRPVATLAPNAEGRMMVDTITLKPKISFEVEVNEQTVEKLHESAHKHCFIANSLLSEQIISPVFE